MIRSKGGHDGYEWMLGCDNEDHFAFWETKVGRRRTGRSQLPIEDGEVSPPSALENMEPDEVHFHEAMGNAGASFERTYRSAALVLCGSGRCSIGAAWSDAALSRIAGREMDCPRRTAGFFDLDRGA